MTEHRIPKPPTAMDGFAIRIAAALYGLRYRTLARYWELAYKYQTLDPRPYCVNAPRMSKHTLERASAVLQAAM